MFQKNPFDPCRCGCTCGVAIDATRSPLSCFRANGRPRLEASHALTTYSGPGLPGQSLATVPCGCRRPSLRAGASCTSWMWNTVSSPKPWIWVVHDSLWGMASSSMLHMTHSRHGNMTRVKPSRSCREVLSSKGGEPEASIGKHSHHMVMHFPIAVPFQGKQKQESQRLQTTALCRCQHTSIHPSIHPCIPPSVPPSIHPSLFHLSMSPSSSPDIDFVGKVAPSHALGWNHFVMAQHAI